MYQAEVRAEGDGYVVAFVFGRRGSTLQTGTKPAQPVPYPQARRIFDRLLTEKTGKGYTQAEDGTPYQHTEKEARNTGHLPQLLNPVDEKEALALLSDPGWAAQEKLDGKRMLVHRVGDQVTGIHRTGLTVDLPEPLVRHALTLRCQHWLMDGEAVGDTFHVFDLLENAYIDLRSQPLARRLAVLSSLLGTATGPAGGTGGPIRLVPTATARAAKHALFASLKSQKREGLVLKRLDAPYLPGRPASGGDWLKLKFTATASCLVAGRNGSKRSVRLELFDAEGRWVSVGNVTVPPGRPLPESGAVLEVRYLYAFPGGCLFQPVYLSIRDDLGRPACTLDQLKFKPDPDRAPGQD